MGVKVNLSNRSQELIGEYLKVCGPRHNNLSNFQSPVDEALLISWLCDEVTTPPNHAIKSEQGMEFILASLRAELMHDLLVSMVGDNPPEEQTTENVSGNVKLKFGLLAFAGILLAGCEGFDSITTMLGILSLPSLVILIVGLGFSILSIVVFYSYDLVQVSKNLGVSLIDAPKLLDVYLKQMDEIQALREKIETYKLAELSTEELTQLERMIIMLQKRFKGLTEASLQFNNAVKSNKVQVAKTIISSMAGFLFFGSGFFAGQSVAMFIAGLFIPVVLPTFWPVILFSFIVGLAALSLYWYVEEVGLKKLVSGLFGLDEDKIDILCNQNTLEKEEVKLENLKEKVISTAKLTSHLTKLQHQLNGAKKEEREPVEYSASKDDELSTFKTSANIYSFHLKPEVQKRLHLEIPDSEHDLVCHNS